MLHVTTLLIIGRRTQVWGTFARTGLPQPVGSASYDTANELTQWNGQLFAYDLNGNMTSDGTNTYTWDARNQLSQFNAVSFQYDADGRRTKNTVGNGLLYDGDDAVQELSGTTVLSNRITGGVDEFFSRTESGNSYTPLTDALGSTIAMVNSSGSIITQYTYDPFGFTTASGSSTNQFQYTGRENDGNGLYYYQARYYNPFIGRFISEDPIEDGDNFYAYADDDPIDFTDPFGLETGDLKRDWDYPPEPPNSDPPRTPIEAPGFGESLIPFWGSGKQALHDFDCGNYGWGTFNTALAISDVFLLKSLATAAGKVGVKGLVKVGGSHTWGATKKWMIKNGWRDFKGQPFHHWLIPQNEWGKAVPEVIKNQPPNVMKMASRVAHDAVEGKGKNAMGPLRRLWHGSPDWAKVASADAAGKAANLAGRK